jgi:hypothetical protein
MKNIIDVNDKKKLIHYGTLTFAKRDERITAF